MALGMVPEQIFKSSISDSRMPFKKGDILTLYTDGVTEVQNSEGKEFGNKRLAEVIKKHCKRDASEIAKGILDRVSLFSGTDNQMDDFTVVIAKHL